MVVEKPKHEDHQGYSKSTKRTIIILCDLCTCFVIFVFQAFAYLTCKISVVFKETETIMSRSIPLVTYLVHDYDEAIAFFTGALRFTLLEDTPLGEGKRWVRVAPPGSPGAALLLAQAASPEQQARTGDQAGGRVFLFLNTDDFWRDYEHMLAHGVRFAEAPRREPYGTVAVFYDLYGNAWDLIQPAEV